MRLPDTALSTYKVLPLPRLLLAALVSLALVVAGCGDSGDDGGAASTTTADAGNGEPQDESTAPTFTQDDSGEEARLAVGDEVVVALEVCVGCGYRWEITQPPDAAVIAAEGPINQPRPTSSTRPGEPPIVGQSSDEIFRFRGLSAGTTNVTIGYFPPTGDTPEESVVFTFLVT